MAKRSCIFIIFRRGSRGAKGALPPPPPISVEKNKGAKNHTHRKKGSKSDNHEARYSLKRTPKHSKYVQIFFKKSCEVGGGGGLRGHKGNILLIKVLKSRKCQKKSQKYNIIQMLKSTPFSHILKNVQFIIRLRSAQICSKSLLKHFIF